ncbi:gamma-glutamyltransferase, partial [Marinobacter alexandrii]
MDKAPQRRNKGARLKRRSESLSAIALTLTLLTASPSFGQAILEGERFHPAVATQGMVATSHTLATDVALQVLKDGGNAIDAAVTAGFALAVTQPRSGNIGG